MLKIHTKTFNLMIFAKVFPLRHFDRCVRYLKQYILRFISAQELFLQLSRRHEVGLQW